MYVAVWEDFVTTKFSDEITPDSLKGMFVTNRTGKSYYTLLWVIQFCSILCTNSDICWTALWADSLHLPGKKSHTAKFSSSNPISTGPPLSHRATQQGARGRLSCSNITQHLLENIIQMSKITHQFHEQIVQSTRRRLEAAPEFTFSQIELGQYARWYFSPKEVCPFGCQKLSFTKTSTQ